MQREFTLFLTFYSPFGRNVPPTVPSKPDVPSFDKVATILDFLSQEFDAVRIIGGEPFVIPFFNDILDFASDRYRNITIESLGTGDVFRSAYLIKQHILEGANIDVAFQFIDMDPSVNDKVVGHGSWESVISSASLLQSTFDIHPKIILYVGSHSTHKYSLLANLGFDIILRRAYGLKVTERSMEAMFRLAQYESVTVDDCVLKAIQEGIPCSREQYVLDYDGNIYMSRYVPTTPIGNIFGMTMDDFLTTVSNAYEQIRNVQFGGKCARCAYIDICGGGDFHFWPDSQKKYDTVCPVHEEAVSELKVDTEPEQEGDEDYSDNEDYGVDEYDTEEEFIESLEE